MISFCKRRYDKVLNIDQRILYIQRAPEPTDVKWENCGASTWSKFCRRIITIISTLIVLGICFGIILGINKA